MKPISVEVIAYAPTQYYHCPHCEVVWNEMDAQGIKKFHTDAQESSIPPDLMLEYRSLSDWIINAAARYGGRVVFKVIDAASAEGLLKCLRYGVREYPAVVVNGKGMHIGTDFKEAETLIDNQLAQGALAGK